MKTIAANANTEYTPVSYTHLDVYKRQAWICLEPAWKRRILNLITAVLFLRLFFLSPTPEAYNKFLPYLVVYTLLTSSFSWLSIVRFKAGKQD